MLSRLASSDDKVRARFGSAGAEARRAAEEASRRSLLRLVSHELRTPLNSIIGFSEIIARELYGPINEPKYREHAEIVREAGLRLLKLVNDVMELARLESGVVDLDPEPLEPTHMLEAVAASFSADAATAGVRIEVQPFSGETVLADSRGLKTVLGQLVQNAVDHSPKGGVITLSVRRVADHVALDVADQGPGVPIQDIARILRPFEQAGDTLTRHNDGAGLGLPIAQKLTQAMGGKLRLSSEPGRGLCASVYLSVAARA